MGIMLNEDCCHFLDSRSNIIEEVGVDYLNAFIDQYADTNVTDFLMNISSTLSYVPSKTFEFAGDKYLVREEWGKSVDYTKDTVIMSAYNIWCEKKLDMYQIWIDRCKYNGINPWLSFRMNNAEFLYNEEPHAHLSNYYYEHYEDQARVQHRKGMSSLDLCRDYGNKDFRAYMLAYIDEMVNKYDVYGIELDFLREHSCFKFGEEWEGRKILTSFMQKIKEIVSTAGDKYGHKIKVLVRCPIEPRIALEWGYDIVEWAKKGLVDVIVPSPNWITTDNDAPLILWKSILEPFGVEVVGCIERNINCNPDYFSTIVNRENGFFLQPNSLETFCGSAAAMLSQIPDKIYLFNYMDDPDTSLTPKAITRPKEEYQTIINCGGDFEKIMRMPRKHIVSYNDTPLPWMNCNTVFPIKFTEGKSFRCIKINTGYIPEDMHCVLRLGMSAEKTDEIYLNSNKVSYTSKQACDNPVLTDNELYCFEIPHSILKEQYQIVEIVAENLIVDYADIIVF